MKLKLAIAKVLHRAAEALEPKVQHFGVHPLNIGPGGDALRFELSPEYLAFLRTLRDPLPGARRC